MIVDKCSDERKTAKAPPGCGLQAVVPVRIPKTSGGTQAAVPVRIPKTSGGIQATALVCVPKASKVSSTTARANTSSAVDEAMEAKIDQTKLDNIAKQRKVDRRLSAWKKWKSSEWGPQARTGPTRATLTAIAVQSMSTPNEVAKRLGEGDVVRI